MPFDKKQEAYIEGIGDISLYLHRKTKALLVHIKNSDNNKVFGIAFRTYPENSKGIPHILEHTVLSESKKYSFAKKDLFAELIKCSVATYINAYTYSDKTVYPVASQCEKDLYNLSSVYLDLVFNPFLKKEHFEKEGWNIEQDNGDVKYGGIVLNEMKGYSMSPDYIMQRLVSKALLSDTVYKYNSGGDPEDIVDLDYDEFLNFYQKNYHPSNAFIFLYGNSDFANLFDLVDGYLNNYSYREIDLSNFSIKQTKKDLNKQVFKDTYPALGDDGLYLTYNILTGWMTSDYLDYYKLLTLDKMLVGDYSSLVYSKLVESAVGDDFISGFDWDDTGKNILFSAGLKNIKENHIDRVVRIVDDVLDDVCANGVSKNDVLSAVNMIEYEFREGRINGYDECYGIGILNFLLKFWGEDYDFINSLNYKKYLSEVRDSFLDKNYLKDFIRQKFIDNNHKAVCVLYPDESIIDKKRKAEEAKIQAYVLQNKDAIEKNKTSGEQQSDKFDIAVLTRDDLRDYGLKTKSIHTDRVLYNEFDTNGMIYFDLVFDLNHLDKKYISFLPLFFKSLIMLNKRKTSYDDFLKKINIYTTGMDYNIYAKCRYADTKKHILFATLSSACLGENTGFMFSFFKEALFDTHFDDKERLRHILKEEVADMKSQILDMGVYTAKLALHKSHYYFKYFDEHISGISYYKFVADLLNNFDKEYGKIIKNLSDIKNFLYNKQNIIYNFSSGANYHSKILEHINSLDSDFAETDLNIKKVDFTGSSDMLPQAVVIPSDCNTVLKSGISLYDLSDKTEVNTAIYLLSNYLRYGYLWDEIRVKGGAYSVECSFDLVSGIMYVGSSKDDNILSTIDTINKLSKYISSINMSKDELEQAIINTISNFDIYLKPRHRNTVQLIRFMTGFNDIRDSVREKILNLTHKDIKESVAFFDEISSSTSVVFIGNKYSFNKIKSKINFDKIEYI